MKHSFYVFFLILLISSYAYTQEPPVKWGEISKADLEMKSLKSDTNASAYILCDFGDVSFNDELNISYYHYIRIKIFSEKGYSWGTWSINLFTGNHEQSIKNIAGCTYSLDEHGNIIKHEMKDKDILTEHENDTHTRYKFTLPSLSPGCILELKYTTIKSGWWNVPDWQF